MAAIPRRIRSHVTLALCLTVGSLGHAQVGTNGEIDGLEAKFVDVNGVRTRYYDYGRGEAIVLVHGGTVLAESQTNANTWSRNIPGLARHFRVLALDRLAQGLTGNPGADEDFGMEADVEHIYQFIRTMKLDGVHLVGHSSSGLSVFYFALTHPEVVKSVTWIGVGGGWRSSQSRSNAIRAKCGDPKSDGFRNCWRAAVYPPAAFSADYVKAEEWIASLPKSVDTRRRAAAILAISPTRESDDRARSRDIIAEKLRAGALQVPVLLYMGKQDLWDWDVDASRAMLQGALTFFDMTAAKNPRVKLIVIPDAGHFVYREQPEQFNADLVQFIEFWNTRP